MPGMVLTSRQTEPVDAAGIVEAEIGAGHAAAAERVMRHRP